MNTTKRKKGFTLVELLVVIAVIALLMAILLPALSRAKEQAKRVLCGHDCKEIGIAVMAYVSDTDLLPFYGGRDPTYSGTFYDDTSSDESTIHPYVAYRDDVRYPGGKLVPHRLACLWERKYIEDPKIFYCPSNMNATYKYASYIRPAGTNESSLWGTLWQAYNQVMGINQWVRTGFSYYPIDAGMNNYVNMTVVGDIPVPLYTARRYSSLSKTAPYLTDGIWKFRKEISHKSGMDAQNVPVNGGINALFKDGHVRFVRNEKVLYHYGFDPTVYNGAIFDNQFWDTWEAANTEGSSTADSIHDSRYIFYSIYSMIKP